MMKRYIILFVVMIMMCISGSAVAKDKEEGKVFINTKDAKPITIVTRNNTIKIYPCGRVVKQVWTELNPNEDSGYVFYSSGDTTEGYITAADVESLLTYTE